MPAPFLAPALVKLRSQINAAYPTRSKVSDGWIGDAAHSARKSEHNPDPDGCVRALDVTHDPKSGCDSYEIAEVIRFSGDDRVLYIISHGQIANAGKPWRPYTGSNPHNHHFHVSLKRGARDDTRDWTITPNPDKPRFPKALKHPVRDEPVLRRGSQNKYVAELQKKLGITVDGDFGDDTKAAVVKFQKMNGVTADGVVGPQTWDLLEEKK